MSLISLATELAQRTATTPPSNMASPSDTRTAPHRASAYTDLSAMGLPYDGERRRAAAGRQLAGGGRVRL